MAIKRGEILGVNPLHSSFVSHQPTGKRGMVEECDKKKENDSFAQRIPGLEPEFVYTLLPVAPLVAPLPLRDPLLLLVGLPRVRASRTYRQDCRGCRYPLHRRYLVA